MARAAFVLFVLLGAANTLSAKTWQEIEPLRSTRADVVRVFNECSDQKEACTFAYNNEDIYILFSGGLDEKYVECAKALPPETVIFIERRPQTAPKPAELRLGSPSFSNVTLTSHWNKASSRYQAHVDKRNGLVVKTRNGSPVQMVYLPSGSVLPVCTAYYKDPESFVELYQGQVPAVSIGCPKDAVFADQQFTVAASSDFDTRKGFEWSVNAGKIIAGQGTSRVIIDATGLSGRMIRVAAVVKDYDLGLVGTATCDVSISRKN